MSKGRRRRAKAKKKTKAHQGDVTKQESTSARSIVPTRSPRTSFLTLPPEIRVQIYSYTIRPETGPFSDFNGLYHSCRLIKKETDYECAKVLHGYLTELKSTTLNDDGLRFHMPMSFAALRNLRISLSTGIFHMRNKRRLSTEELLEHLEVVFALHLDTLVIAYHEDDTGYKFGMTHVRWLTRAILNTAMVGNPCSIKARRVAFDLPVMDSECAEAWRNTLCYHNPRYDTWSPRHPHHDWSPVKLVMRRGRRPVAIYPRAGFNAGYKVARGDVWVMALQGRRYWFEQVYGVFAVIVIVYVSLLCKAEKMEWSFKSR